MEQKTSRENPAQTEKLDQASVVAASFPRGFRSLEKLRDRVELASIEMARLREENAELSKRITTLQNDANPGSENTIELDLEDDPQLLRKKIDLFIAAIDEYLENEQSILPPESEAS